MNKDHADRRSGRRGASLLLVLGLVLIAFGATSVIRRQFPEGLASLAIGAAAATGGGLNLLGREGIASRAVGRALRLSPDSVKRAAIFAAFVAATGYLIWLGISQWDQGRDAEATLTLLIAGISAWVAIQVIRGASARSKK